MNPAEILKMLFLGESYNEMIWRKTLVICLVEHHMLSFYGKARGIYHNCLIVGLSKIHRVVDVFSHAEMQKRLTE
ncbi:MAG: hypothetical protein CM15mP83_9460 [Flavobacteriaceae bacterium]|nr:MAG: hypothetical protein CM15mP83_9460 [Flavobacteriaceae bacterium]